MVILVRNKEKAKGLDGQRERVARQNLIRLVVVGAPIVRAIRKAVVHPGEQHPTTCDAIGKRFWITANSPHSSEFAVFWY